MAPTRLIYVADLHGSITCWSKLLQLARRLKPDCIIVGGDLLGPGVDPKLLKRWETMANDMLNPEILITMNPGNYDPPDIDGVLKECRRFVYAVGEVVVLNGRHEMITCDHVNPSPFNTFRELPEEKLLEVLEDLISRLNSVENAVFNFHAPPYGTRLDVVSRFGEAMHVGSRAVRTVIERYQPVLSLHGHIHESANVDKIGRTVCVNPGSQHNRGILNYALIELEEKVSCELASI